jgi:cytochrome c553
MNSGRSNSGAAAMFAAALTYLAACAALAADDIPPKAAACIECHGTGGPLTDPAMPSLAGQPKQFIVTQLFMFREGKRKDSQMSPAAANLTNADLNELAAYFSTQKLEPPARTADPSKYAAARRLAEQYYCVQCHGPGLMGQQHIPRLAGQQREYLRAQLRAFKTSTRFDMDGQMSSAAQLLSDANIDILADFLAASK